MKGSEPFLFLLCRRPLCDECAVSVENTAGAGGLPWLAEVLAIKGGNDMYEPWCRPKKFQYSKRSIFDPVGCRQVVIKDIYSHAAALSHIAAVSRLLAGVACGFSWRASLVFS